MRTFAGIEPRFAEYDNAAILLQSIPYDGTSTWGKGADSGFEAFVEASENMELYDIETNSEVYRRGVHMLPALTESSSPEAMFQAVYENTKKLIRTGKFLTFFGGEHSISIGILKALYEAYPGITVLQMDAHTDLRPEYHGTPYNHACALYDASRNTNLVQVGIRSMDKAEMQFVNRSACFFAEEIYGSHSWMSKALDLMTDPVYITFDLDAFDPGIMPATGTPEPGGLDWNTTITFLRQVFEQRNVIGFDIVELAPDPHHKASNFLAAKLYYKMLSYAFEIK
jgi:agmatinase